MNAVLLAAARTAIQAGWGWLVAHLPLLAIVPSSAVVDFVVTVVVIGGATAGLRWLETRQGDGLWPRLARGVAKALMLGLSKRQPTYSETRP